VEASALTQPVSGTHGRSPLLRLQSDERLIALVRRGNHAAFETLVSRYQARLLAFCRHMLGSREDAEDVLQEVFAAAFNAILADERPINARPWLYRIARNRSLNHLRRVQPIGVDSMDIHLSEHGTTTADKVDKREQFRELIADVHELPETQRTALLLREIDALSYEQIAEAMETTVPSVKSLLVRARVSLAEAAEARLLSCEDVRTELGEIAEGLRRRTTPPVRRHLRTCERCATFRTELRATSKALALLLPVGPLLLAKKLFLAHLGLSSMAGGTGGAGSAATGTAAVGAIAGGAGAASSGSLVSAGLGALGAKAAAGIAAAALVTAGAVEMEHTSPRAHATSHPQVIAQRLPQQSAAGAVVQPAPARVQRAIDAPAEHARPHDKPAHAPAATTTTTQTTSTVPAADPTTTADAGRTQVETGVTTLPSTLPAQTPPPTLVPATTPAASAPTTTTPTTTTPPPTSTTPAPPSSTTPTTPPDDAGTGTTPTPPPTATDDAPPPPADGEQP
jgi:RNA polymerase sigma factor (sigma-70 family)